MAQAQMEVVQVASAAVHSFSQISSVACVALKLRQLLREAIDYRRHEKIAIDACSQRRLRLRANSNLDRLRCRTRSNSPSAKSAKSEPHRKSTRHLDRLINDLDRHSPFGSKSISEIASDDRLMCDQSPDALMEVTARRLAWAEAAYMFNMSTFLIFKLEELSLTNSDASKVLPTCGKESSRLRDEKFIANLLHLLRRLQAFVFQILVHRTRAEVDIGDERLQAFFDHQQNQDSECIKEWPSGRRPLSTTWPWNIRPSLVVLWGVCWMFYPPRQGRKAAPRTSAGPSQGTFAFAEEWSQNLPMTSAAAGTSGTMSQAMLARHGSTQAETYGATPAAPQSWHDTGGASQRPGPSRHNLQGHEGVHPPPAGSYYGPAWIPDLAASHVTRSPSTYYPVPVDATHLSGIVWPDSVGDNFPSQLGQAQSGLYAADIWPPQYQATPQALYQYQYQGSSSAAPSLEVSPVSTSTFPALGPTALPSRQQRLFSRTTEPDQYNYTMGDPGVYPLSPRSDRQRSISRSIASAGSVNAMLSPDHSSPASESSRRARSAKRERTPPRNAAGQIYCDHPDCAGKNITITFRRPCEWRKHMDKHERPWKCYEPGCETNPGFTYSGGLLRHQREVHKMHLSARKPLYCPFPNCNRSSGTGFTRRENLEEHKRRRHLGESAGSPSVSTSPASTTHSASMPPPLRKRRRQDKVPEEDDEDEDEGEEEADDSSSVATTTSLRMVRRLTQEIARRDEVIRQQGAELAKMRHVLQLTRHAPATTA